MLLYTLFSLVYADTNITVIGDAYAKYDSNKPD
jgi:hypothetical protein